MVLRTSIEVTCSSARGYGTGSVVVGLALLRFAGSLMIIGVR